MSNSNGTDRMRELQLRAFAENLYTLANRHRDHRSYVVAHALYGRALEAAEKCETPEHKKNGNALVTRIQKDRQEVYELLQREGSRQDKALLEKAQRVGQ